MSERQSIKQPGSFAEQGGRTEVDEDMNAADHRHANKPFDVVTWNVMGLTTVGEELKSIVLDREPDVVVLTETKLLEETHNRAWVKGTLLNMYTIYGSSIRATDSRRYNNAQGQCRDRARRMGSGGVLMAIHQRWMNGTTIMRHVYENCSGHLIGIDLKALDSPPIRLIGVYMPHDMPRRKEMYAALSSKVQEDMFKIVGGDWNAALLPGDRADQSALHHTCMDDHHKEFVQGCKLSPLHS